MAYRAIQDLLAGACGWSASGACCCYPSGWQAAQGVQPASLAAVTDSIWTSPSGMKRMRTQSVLWYLGTPGTTVTRPAPGAAPPSAVAGGSLSVSPAAAASPSAPSAPASPASPSCVAGSAAWLSPPEAPGPGNAMMSAPDPSAASARSPAAASGVAASAVSAAELAVPGALAVTGVTSSGPASPAVPRAEPGTRSPAPRLLSGRVGRGRSRPPRRSRPCRHRARSSESASRRLRRCHQTRSRRHLTPCRLTPWEPPPWGPPP